VCGICGVLNLDGAPVDSEIIARMMQLLVHRGPDGSGLFTDGPMGLGHRRLSIIDLDTGKQPMCNEDGTVWIVYNGEIYNYRELRGDLASRHRFKSTSDTEVIVHLYEEMGDACVSRLNGMFAFALWDALRSRLLLARYLVGINPLYFEISGNVLVFGSEIKSLLAHDKVDSGLNMPAIDRFLSYYYLPGSETLLEAVHKLPPAHYLVVENGGVSVHRYWTLSFDHAASKPSFKEAVVELRDLLSRTVRDHMVSDVPVGVLLSGGVDSTGILSYAAQHANGPIHTFTVGFQGEGFDDERPYAKLASRVFGTDHSDISISAEQFRDFLPTYVWHMEEPVCEPPAVALYFGSRLAKQASIKVLLSGEGGDEAFGGYETYRNLVALESLKRVFKGPANRLLHHGLRLLGRGGCERVGQYGDLVPVSFDTYYLSRTATPLTPFNRIKRELYDPSFQSAVDAGDPSAPTRRLLDEVHDLPVLERMLYVDTNSWLPDDLLLKADRMTMATSVELRVPLLDSRILEFAAALPGNYKVRGWHLKRILKAALRPTIPAQILARRKCGFPVPYDRWMRNELRHFVADTLLASDARISQLFRRNALSKLIAIHQSGSNRSKELFSLLVLELSLQRFADARHPLR
jgi:asparagine synthase (glutamine-hydrolysing)